MKNFDEYIVRFDTIEKISFATYVTDSNYGYDNVDEYISLKIKTTSKDTISIDFRDQEEAEKAFKKLKEIMQIKPFWLLVNIVKKEFEYV